MDYNDSAGALAGDSTARRIQAAVRSATTGQISILEIVFQHSQIWG